ncbi:hypothetical protein AB0Q95_35985 [Streptomyces sp. NPDC059900]|uniref:hypothetical protein n=1 Tax=Streptomyces sp. NPDC059900 TaxID=3155816 RepID=UPI00342D354C
MELVARASTPQLAEGALLTAVRWLALLPAEWKPQLQELPPVGTSIVVRLHHDDDLTVDAVRAGASDALSDPALLGWELVDCRMVA